jgi:hypothetical protein
MNDRGEYLSTTYTPAYYRGDRIIVCLDQHEQGYYKPQGLFNGVFQIINDRVDGTTISADEVKRQVRELLSGDRSSFAPSIPRFSSETLRQSGATVAGKTMDVGGHMTGKNRFVAFDMSWDPPVVEYDYNPTFAPAGSLSDVLARIDSAFTIWNDIPLNAHTFTYGEIDTEHFHSDDDQSVIYFADYNNGTMAENLWYPGWPDDPPGVGNLIGSDIVFNTDYTWNVGATPIARDESPGAPRDFADVLIHELGHTLGLWHSGTPKTRMYEYYQSCEVPLRRIAAGDSAGAVHQHPMQTLSGSARISLVLPGPPWTGFSGYNVSGGFSVSGKSLVDKTHIYLEDDASITVNSGATFTAGNYSVFHATSSSPVNVYGTFNANGAEFYGSGESWPGIRFYSGSSGTIQNSTFSNIGSSGRAVHISGASPTVKDSDITSSGYGIYVEGVSAYPQLTYNTISVSGSSGSRMGIRVSNASPTITNSAITSPSYGIYVAGTSAFPSIRNNTLAATTAIWFTGAGGYVQANTIDGNGSGAGGIGADEGADPILGQEDLGPGNNIITGYAYGLMAGNGSNLWSQGYDCVSEVDQYHILSFTSADVSAIYDWWGGGNPDVIYGWGGTVEWSPKYPYSTCPASGAPKTLLQEPPLSSEIADDDLPGRLQQARVLRVSGKTADAVAEYKALIGDAPSSPQAASAYLDLGRLARRALDSDLARYLESEAAGGTEYRLHILGMLIGYYLNSGDETRAIETARVVENEGDGTWHAFSALWQMFEMHMKGERFADAAGAFGRMRPLNEIDEMLMAQISDDLSERAPGEFARLADAGAIDQDLETSTLEISAFPNPFNPTTTITFRLPEGAKTSVQVYDVQGRSVARIASGDYPAGTHSVEWDASGVASGLYLAVVTGGSRSAHIPLVVSK